MSSGKATMIKIASVVAVLLVIAIGAYIFANNKFKNIIIDNPTNAEITVKIDDTEHKIPALGSLTTAVNYGTHSVSLNGENVGDFEHKKDHIVMLMLKIADPKFPVLNPTKTQYVIVHEIYTSSADKENTISDPVVRDLYIPATWNYGLDEAFPTTVSTTSRRGSPSNKEIVKNKIFRVADYTKEYGIEVGEDETTIHYE